MNRSSSGAITLDELAAQFAVSREVVRVTIHDAEYYESCDLSDTVTLIPLPLSLEAKLELITLRENQKVSIDDLAIRFSVSAAAVRRVLANAKHYHRSTKSTQQDL